METRTNNQICPVCGHENSADEAICPECEYDFLGETRIPKNMKNPITDKFDNTSAIPDLAKLGLLDDDDYEDYEVDNADVKTLHIDSIREPDRPIGDGAVKLKGNLILTERESNQQFVIPSDMLDNAVIGRMNRDTGRRPAIDLTELEGHKYGVSRRHATISYRDNWLVLIDHSSTNGTFLNGHRLVPEQPRVIRDNDTIRIGAMIFYVHFEQVEN